MKFFEVLMSLKISIITKSTDITKSQYFIKQNMKFTYVLKSVHKQTKHEVYRCIKISENKYVNKSNMKFTNETISIQVCTLTKKHEDYQKIMSLKLGTLTKKIRHLPKKLFSLKSVH